MTGVPEEVRAAYRRAHPAYEEALCRWHEKEQAHAEALERAVRESQKKLRREFNWMVGIFLTGWVGVLLFGDSVIRLYVALGFGLCVAVVIAAFAIAGVKR